MIWKLVKICTLVAIALLALVLVMAIMHEPADPAERERRVCSVDGGGDARTMAQQFVRRQLVAPSTAEFPTGMSRVQHVYVGDCEHTIGSWVDAQNRFGAMLRTHYRVGLRYMPETDTWRQLWIEGF